MWNQDEFKRALDFAARAHGAQLVPGSGAPYVVHLIKVSTEAIRAALVDSTLNIDLVAQAALLHDSIEDTNTTFDEIEKQFGDAVARAVLCLTKNAALEKSEQMPDSLGRLQSGPREARVVKLADRITNLEPPPSHWTVEKTKKYLAEARAIHLALGEASAFLSSRMIQKMSEYEPHCR